ncbi:hypothetical protein [Streptomyces sp. MOE7]|uniref:hypothetical protein n=1 Tax=Streptomyces sp. MOE7 TaxID=1961713 RepID=UPI001314F297|nr:hypothetical protein [Streptomyces sp. MOE7]
MPTAATTVWEDFEVPAHARGGQVTLNLHDHLAAVFGVSEAGVAVQGGVCG